MDYGTFIERGHQPWADLEARLTEAERGRMAAIGYEDLQRLSSLHRRAISDYALARTHFGGTDVERRLGALALRGHRLLASRHDPVLQRIIRFYLHDYGGIFREAGPALRASLAIFCGAAAVGALLTWIDHDFAALLIGVDALEMIKEGEIWTDFVSAAAPPSVLSGYIFTNNMSVAIAVWAGGALLGLGTVAALATNGAMVGSLFTVCAQYDLVGRLLAFISAHGPLELFLITVAGAAGLMLGRAEIAWDNRPRGEAFGLAARQSVRLMLGTLPWFVLLGLVEGYLSPIMSIPTLAKAVVGIVLLLFFLVSTGLSR